VALFGRRGLVSIALGITASRLYPTLKYALGYGKECRRVMVNGVPVVPRTKRLPGDAAEGDPRPFRERVA
jgi:hypothetical protein